MMKLTHGIPKMNEIPKNVKELREILDDIVLNIHNLAPEYRQRACESLSSFSGKFARVTAGVSPEGSFVIHITPNEDNIVHYKALNEQKAFIEEQLLKIENPREYEMRKVDKQLKEHPWKSGYVVNLKDGSENPIISSYTAKRFVFDDWFKQTLDIATDEDVMGNSHVKSDSREFKTLEEADKWLKSELEQFQV